jgi:hypothetical protein
MFMEAIKLGEYPTSVDRNDYDQIIDKRIIGTFAPIAPPLSLDQKIVCVGSCFADELAQHLTAQNRDVIYLSLWEIFNTAYAVRHFLEYALENKPFPEGFVGKAFVAVDTAQLRVREGNAFLITLGLSLCWFDLRTNRMTMSPNFGKHTVKSLLNFTMRQTSVSDNVAQIDGIISCIRRVKGNVPIIFTLSPIPINHAINEWPPITSNMISKATLHTALYETMQRQHDEVYYWPAYEIIDFVGRNVRLIWGPPHSNDVRHPDPAVVAMIMQKFASLYFKVQD